MSDNPGLLGRVEDALRSKHSDDVIVPECKDGPTHSTTHLRLDYWVLRRSWTRPAMIGYEVKTSRADFLRDQKWPQYLPLCNELWLVEAVRGIIQPEELPETVGLYRLAGSRLVTVRKSVWREIPPPESLLTYVIMCRSRIGREHGETREQRVAYWREWLADKDESRGLGHRCSKGLREKFDRLTDEIRNENHRLKREAESVAGVIEELDALGIPWRQGRYRAAEYVMAARWDRKEVEACRDMLTKLLNGEVQP